MEPHERLNKAMSERRLALKLRWVEISAAAKISPEALRAIRRGAYRPSPLTARALDEALRWSAGSVERVLDGGDPLPLLDARPTPGVLTTEELIEASHRDLDAIEEELDRRLRAARRDPGQLRKILEAVEEIQREP